MQIARLKIFTLWVIIFSFSLLVFSLNEAEAQTLSLGIYPPLLEAMIMPGKGITQVYKLINSGETDLAFTSKVVPFEPDDEMGTVRLITDQPSPATPWFSFQNADLDLGEKFLVKAGEEQEVVLKIKVPNNAQEDDYYLTLLFETIPGLFLGQTGPQTQAKIGANILLTVSKDGQPPKKAELVEFGLRSSVLGLPIIDSFTKPQFTLRIKNTGRAFFKPMGTITTTGWLGQKFILDLLPENVVVNSIRQIQCQFDDEFGPCQLGSRFLVGRYQAQVEFGLDQLTGGYTAKTTFFAVPIKLILGLIIGLAIIWLVKTKLPLDKRFL